MVDELTVVDRIPLNRVGWTRGASVFFFLYFFYYRSIGKRRSWFIVATKGIFFNRVLDRRKKSESFVLRNTLDPLRHASSRGCRISISGGDLPVSRLEIRL